MKTEQRLSKEETTTRGSWTSQTQFLLACVGCSVGLGNVWRFGYLCSKSGGGAFMIPYFVSLLVIAVPLVLMEFVLGQYTQRGPVGAFRMISPLFKGVGWATVVTSFFLTTYYVAIIVWDTKYIFSSISAQVPWSSCNNSWNTELCWDGTQNLSQLKNQKLLRSPSEEFFRYNILAESESMNEFGWPNQDLFFILILVSFVVYFCIWKGVKSTGKVVYVTAVFPYFVLIVLLIRGLTLDGSMNGLRYFLVPKWGDLKRPGIWTNAANFNSIGVAFGSLVTLSSYNTPKRKLIRLTILFAFIDALTSIICGTTIFSILGYIAHTQGKRVEEVVRGGPGLVFMVIPEAIRNMTWAPFWGFLFFLMIFMLGIDSQFTMVETVVTTLEDEFKSTVGKYFKKRETLVLAVVFVLFILALPNLCPGGIYYFTLIDFHAAGISIFYIAFFEIVCILWVYGGKRLAKNYYTMTNQRINCFFLICWYVITPALVFLIWAMNWYRYEAIKYGDYEYSVWAKTFGWLVSLTSIACIPLGALHELLKSPGNSLKQPKIEDMPELVEDKEPPLIHNIVSTC